MYQLSHENEEVMHLLIIAAACIGAVLTTIFSLTHGIFEVFPFLYILPIILVVYFFPKRAVLFSLAIGLMYMGLIYLLGFSNPSLIINATAWFALFIIIGVVASSYANRLLDEKNRIRDIIYNTQDGIFCLDLHTHTILEMNAKCAHWLKFDRTDLIGKDISTLWTEPGDSEQFIDHISKGQVGAETEVLFRAQDGTVLRFVLSAVLVTRQRALCSVIDITGSKIVDEEIRQTLEDLEGQVKARTAHLEKINEELRAEILERRNFESVILSRNIQQSEDDRK